MIIKEFIKESHVAQGDLAFIYHKTKPSKTGWWRKVREGSSENKKIYFVLEKPMHKNFDIEHETMTSHVEKGFCVMSDKTLRYGIDEHKYEILADVRGVHSLFLSSRGYILNDVYFGSKLTISEKDENVFITKRFEKLVELYKPQRKQISDIESLVGDLL